MSYQKTTIAKVIEYIGNNRMYLPAIQRKYVWSEEQITKLMDSILRGYPFGTFLFWKVKKETVNKKNYSMYHFIKNYHERDNFRNEPAQHPFVINADSPDEYICSALDGQQRLTSLFISLMGSLSLKLPRKHWNNDDAFPKKELYFDLHSSSTDEDDIEYSFAFFTEEDLKDKVQNNELWYRVKDIVQYARPEDITDMLIEKGWSSDRDAIRNINALFNSIKVSELINYFEVTSDSIDDVLDIFVRVNSGGTILSKTDLLFSTIVSYWDKGREEIDDLLRDVNRIGEHYHFSSDFIMRICLYVMDMPVSLKVENFGFDNVNKIKTNWLDIKRAIKDTVHLLNEMGFNAENIVAANAILPIVYYRFKYGADAFKEDAAGKVIIEIRKYFVLSQLNHIFGRAANTALSNIRVVLKKHTEKFKLDILQNISFGGEKALQFSIIDIEYWFDEYEKNAYTFMILSLLYPNFKYGQKGFHQDHMHPYVAFDNNLDTLKLSDGKKMDDGKIKLWKHQRNTLANLQLLEGRENEIKNATPLEEWLKIPANRENVKYLPQNINYCLENFDEFWEKRRALMIDELKRIFC